jgi:hypothetical protein
MYGAVLKSITVRTEPIGLSSAKVDLPTCVLLQANLPNSVPSLQAILFESMVERSTIDTIFMLGTGRWTGA